MRELPTTNRLVLGILAPVDAGKTTLAESMLYLSGRIRKLGRVDKKDAYLDTHYLERARGITIFAKQALFTLENTEITLLDTPGHQDFSSEMERTLQILDYAVLVISGADGVRGHTKTLWRLLEMYKIPVFIFVNKMDQPGTDPEALLLDLKDQLSGGCLDFGALDSEDFWEELALCDEKLMETYLHTGKIGTKRIQRAVGERRVFPCFFGSALKMEGVAQFLQGICAFTRVPSYPRQFGAEIFKVSRDEQGGRWTHMKIVGGTLRVRDPLQGAAWQEKVNQIRLYSGERFAVVEEVGAGSVCAVSGLSQAKPGEGLGVGAGSRAPFLEPVLSFQVVLPAACDPGTMLPKLRLLEEEQPELALVWDEKLGEIQVQIMGQVQLEVLQGLIADRFGVAVRFGEGRVLYKETIANTVEGVGHFEPPGHYAEVQLLLEPGPPGSGLHFASDCSEDVLAKNWQRLVLSHLKEKTHKGVLTGSAITDLKITLLGGRAHPEHTQGGDFRQAVDRAVRQGLKEAQSVLLEPYYSFQLEIPERMIGRALTDVKRREGACEIRGSKGGRALLEGFGPAVTLRNYQKEVSAYTRGLGRFFYSLAGYRPCHNQKEVLAELGYDAEKDAEHPTGSVFTAPGGGFYVPWDRVKDYMHLARVLPEEKPVPQETPSPPRRKKELEEIDYELLKRTVSGNWGRKPKWKKGKKSGLQPGEPSVSPKQARESYLLVDGYNIIHAWPDLKELAGDNLDLARIKLLDLLASYRGVKNCRIIVVFDAYRSERNLEKRTDYHNIGLVFTKKAQTADQYIEKFAYAHRGKYDIKVATGDVLQQVLIKTAGCRSLSPEELKEEVEKALKSGRRSYRGQYSLQKVSLEELLSCSEKRGAPKKAKD